MEACCEQQSNGWCLLLPSEADGRPMERVAFPSFETAQQALRLVALHAALTAGQPSDEVQRLRAELEVHGAEYCDNEAMEELRQYSRGHLLNLLRATAAGEDSEVATVSTAAAPQRAVSPACEGLLPRAAEAEAAEAAGLAAQERQEQRPQQHELLQEPAARPQQETPMGTGAAALQQAAPKQAAPQQAAVQQHEPQQPELALPGGFYHHYFGVTPQLPDPTVTSYKAQLNLALASNGQPQRPSRRVGGKAAQPVCLLACPTQAEAAAARDLGALWREQRLRGGGSKPHRGHRPLFNFDESRWEQEQGELLAAVRQCATLRQLQQLLAVCLANGTLRALGSSMPRDAASWQLATQRRAADGDGSKRWRPSLKRALAQLAQGRSRSWDGLQHGLDGGTVSGGEEGGRRWRRHSRLARSQSLTDSHGYDSELAEQEAAAAGVRQPVLQSTGAAQAALLALAAAAAADPQEGQAGAAMATEGTAAVDAAAVGAAQGPQAEGAAGGAAAGAADELESDYLGVRKCPDGGWRVVVPVRLDGLGAPALVGFKCLQSFELLSEQEAALVRDLGLLWYEQWCGPESFRDNRLWNFALRRYLHDAPLWSVLSRLPNWPSFESYVAQLQASGLLAEAAKAYDEGESAVEWPDPQCGLPEDQQQAPPKQQQQQQVRRQRQQQKQPEAGAAAAQRGRRRRQQQEQPEACTAASQQGRRMRQRGKRPRRELSPGLTTQEAAAAARACKATAEAAAALAPKEAWEEMAAAWRQQSQQQAQAWEVAVQPYATDWLLQGSQLQHMLCPPAAKGRQQDRPASTAGGTAPPANYKGIRPQPAAYPASGKGIRPEAAVGPAGGVGDPGTARQQQGQHQRSADEAAAAMPLPAQPAASPARQQRGAQPAGASTSPGQQHRKAQPAGAGASPAQQQERRPGPAAARQAIPPAGAHASPATPPAPDAQHAATSQLPAASTAQLRTLLDNLPVCPHSSENQGMSPAARHPPPVLAPGDVLLYCRRTNGIAGLPLLERLLVLSAASLDVPSPRISQRCTCLLFAQGANAQQLVPPAGIPAQRVVEVGPSGFRAKILAVRTTSQWSVVGHVAREPMEAVWSMLAALEQQ